MKKSLIGKLLKWVISFVFIIIFIILLWNSFVIQQIITKTAKENLNAVSALNARTAEKFVAAFQEVTESMAAEIERVPPYMRGMTAEAFARSYLSVNDTAQSVWIEFEENEAYGGLKAADPFASLYQVPGGFLRERRF